MEALAEQQAPSRYKPVSKDESGKKSKGNGEGSGGVSAPAKVLLRFSAPRDPAALLRSSTCASCIPSTSTGAGAWKPP
ncbi:hypothetical protein [Streptomyces sp. NPDC055105]|uniref:hypothetical protein n=1 Tax=Streptomyces sp. NPDC055105 TaxID=3365719 RepID=UPI0037D44A22